VRLFVALEIPESARREVRRRCERLRGELPRARWVDPGLLHLTLAFLGEVDPARQEPLAVALRGAFAAHAALELGLEDAGGFPPGRPARVAWVGVRAASGLAPLQSAVAAAAAAAAGVAPEAREFHPHLTLARCDPPWGVEALERFRQAFAGPVGERFVASSGVLFESRLGAGGARHLVLGEFPLSEARR
jgi:2'-5' RNA ligase